MKPNYLAYRNELVEEGLSHYRQPRDTISIPYFLKGNCTSWARKFKAKWPHLEVVFGFYNGAEHAWCVEPDGTIVDPTVGQFVGWPCEDGDPALYKVLDPDKDQVFLGKCMNCGNEIYGLPREGYKSVCDDDPEQGIDCQAQLERYYNGLISEYRR